MRTASITICLILVLGMAGSAVGAKIGNTWGGGSESWTTLSSWYDQGCCDYSKHVTGNWVTPSTALPTLADRVYFGGDRAPGSTPLGTPTLPGTLPTDASTIGASVIAEAKNVQLLGRWTPQNMTMTVEANGTLTTAEYMTIGEDWDKPCGAPDNSAHTVTTAGTINIGTYLNLGASTGSGNNSSNSYGRLLITGGVVKVNDSSGTGIRFYAGGQ
jgi:hypothetical protein